ncbi:MAG TPA: LPS assembly lipoprotein LptE [Steroidobacteraceae bacterium]|nr:LPS assembly lipoprotein LptE [Steroidobacteraceae bacterium]
MSLTTGRGVPALLLALLLAVGASACGFRLQGDVTLPAGMQSVYVATADELTPFSVALRRSLGDSGAVMAGSAGEADVVLRVIRDRSGRRVLSVSARNTPQEYEIYYSLDYSVDRAGQQVIPPQSLELTRNLSFDESLLLAKENEEEILRDAMARDLAGLVMRRLESL